jgi:hypothetical protein
LGLIAAKEGVEYMRKKKPAAKKSTKKSGVRHGGNPEASLSLDSPAPYPSSVTDGVAATPADSAIANTPTISTGASPAHLGGGAARSAAIASEFRKMASEISAFLQKRKAKAASKPKKPAAKPKKGGAECDAKKGKKTKKC